MGMYEPYLGEIAIFAGDFAPVGWFPCDGRLLPIAQYQPLYAILGITYGGDGRTNFALPDLRGRSALGSGTGSGLTQRTIGQNGGQEKVGLGINELPTHNHSAQSAAGGTGQLNCVQDAGSAPNPTGAYIAAHAAFRKSGTMVKMKSDAVAFTASNLTINTTVANAGTNVQHENMHPYLGVNYLIAFQGIFPSRE